jgi:hypothetical protein
LNDNTSTLLNSGQILLTGGYAEGWAYDQAELYQPTSFIPPGLVSIAIRPRPLLVEAGDARQLFAIGTFEGWRKQILYSVNWSSSTPQVAEVSDAGVVYGKKPGIVTITARTGSTHGSVTFIVVKQKWGDLR